MRVLKGFCGAFNDDDGGDEDDDGDGDVCPCDAQSPLDESATSDNWLLAGSPG